jgi:RloB-like protein
MLVVTNGQCTERQYFEGLRCEPSLVVTLRVTVKCEAPQALVARAAALRNASDYDHVWVVCDVDEYDVSQAISDAANNGVGLALSKPCFEVWLILHRSESCPGFNDAAQACVYVRKLLPSWQKERLNFADFRDDVADAVARAKLRGEPPEANPSTAVWRVVKCAWGFASSER